MHATRKVCSTGKAKKNSSDDAYWGKGEPGGLGVL